MFTFLPAIIYTKFIKSSRHLILIFPSQPLPSLSLPHTPLIPIPPQPLSLPFPSQPLSLPFHSLCLCLSVSVSLCVSVLIYVLYLKELFKYTDPGNHTPHMHIQPFTSDNIICSLSSSELLGNIRPEVSNSQG